jgi:hypothetical protein
MNIYRRDVKDSLMITNGYMRQAWQVSRVDASPAS